MSKYSEHIQATDRLCKTLREGDMHSLASFVIGRVSLIYMLASVSYES